MPTDSTSDSVRGSALPGRSLSETESSVEERADLWLGLPVIV